MASKAGVRDQPALGGGYKLGAIQDHEGTWQPRIKLSDNSVKTSTPGIQQVRRYYRDGEMVGDLLWSELIGEPDQSEQSATFDRQEDLLQPVVRDGCLVAPLPDLATIRQHTTAGLQAMPRQFLKLTDATAYPVMLESRLNLQKERLMNTL